MGEVTALDRSAGLAALELRNVTERIAMDLFAACIDGEDLAEYPGI